MDDSDIDEMQKVERSENDDEFWQLVATTTGTICTYYYKYIYIRNHAWIHIKQGYDGCQR